MPPVLGDQRLPFERELHCAHDKLSPPIAVSYMKGGTSQTSVEPHASRREPALGGPDVIGEPVKEVRDAPAGLQEANY